MPHFLFILSLVVIGYTYMGYPVGIAVYARLRPRRWKRAPWPAAKTSDLFVPWHPSVHSHRNDASVQPPISIIMAVHNGGSILPAKIAHLFSLDHSLVGEIIIVSDGSTDGTNHLLRRTWDPRLRVVLLNGQGGKASAINHGIAAATGEILLFVDLRPWIAPDALSSLLANFADAGVGCVAGELMVKTHAHEGATRAVGGLYWRYEQWIRNSESMCDSPVGVYGGFYAIRRRLATLAPAGLILDDMFQPLSIIRQGYRSVVDRNAIVTDTWPSHPAGEFQRKVRTLAGNFQLIAQTPWIFTRENRVLFQLISHKLLRLAVPYFLLLLLISSAVLGVHSAGYAAFALMQAVFWLLAVAGLNTRVSLLHRIAGPASALLVLNAAAVAGLYTFLFTQGPLWKIWTPTNVQDRRTGAEQMTHAA